jgi:drug/metabolite transporter (DMT)-like permease
LGMIWTAPFGAIGLAGSTFAKGSALAMLALGPICTGVAFVIMGRLVGRVGSSRASFSIYMVPAVAVVLGSVFLDEQVHAISLAGIGLVVVGALLASRRDVSA